MITYEDFKKVDMRIGKILEVEDFPEARKPAYKLKIDFGEEIGTKLSSAQITEFYSKEQLEDKFIIAVVNFPPKSIAGFKSEVLVLGVDSSEGIVLIEPESEVELGKRVY